MKPGREPHTTTTRHGLVSFTKQRTAVAAAQQRRQKDTTVPLSLCLLLSSPPISLELKINNTAHTGRWNNTWVRLVRQGLVSKKAPAPAPSLTCTQPPSPNLCSPPPSKHLLSRLFMVPRHHHLLSRRHHRRGPPRVRAEGPPMSANPSARPPSSSSTALSLPSPRERPTDG